MKKTILILISIIILPDIVHAAFPVVTKEKIESSNQDQVFINSNDISSNSDTPVFGIVSIIFAFISGILLFLAPTSLILSLIFALLAIISGGLGFNKRLKALAFIGFFIGILETIFTSLFLLVISLAMKTTKN